MAINCIHHDKMVIIYVVTDMRLLPTQQQMTAVYPHSQGGFMIIDFHTHTFPDELADRAVGTLAHSGGIHNYLDGRVHSLTDSMKKAGIDYSVLLPVATKPNQCDTINTLALKTNETSKTTGLISFGAIHPACENFREILNWLSNNGFKGIKLHPVFQKTNIDDMQSLRLIEYASSLGLIILIHAGFDVSFPGCDESSVDRLATMIQEVKPEKLVLAHMGGWGQWNEVAGILEEDYMKNVYLDTSSCIKKLNHNASLPIEKFKKMVLTHGADHILFGSDSPWDDQKDAVELIKECGFSEKDTDAILGKNAVTLLNL